jgi:hypothetical protein
MLGLCDSRISFYSHSIACTAKIACSVSSFESQTEVGVSDEARRTGDELFPMGDSVWGIFTCQWGKGRGSQLLLFHVRDIVRAMAPIQVQVHCERRFHAGGQQLPIRAGHV